MPAAADRVGAFARSGFAFPSGHSTDAAAVYGILARCCSPARPGGRPGWSPWPAIPSGAGRRAAADLRRWDRPADTHYRHTTPEMATRVVAAVEERLVIVLETADAVLDQQPW
jgi:hypothetical protein